MFGLQGSESDIFPCVASRAIKNWTTHRGVEIDTGIDCVWGICMYNMAQYVEQYIEARVPR